MRFVSVNTDTGHQLATLRGDSVFLCRDLGFEGTLLDLVDSGPEGLERLRNALNAADENAAFAGSMSEVKLGAPIERPRRTVFCAGKTYADHAVEYTKSGYDKADAQEVPDVPVAFFKLAECAVATGVPVEAQAGVTAEMDYEAELAAILWRGGRGLSKEQAEASIFGYMMVNDLTARDWQKGHDQWVLGKSFDGYLPMGPIVVTADEVTSIADLSFECHVNGEHRQTGNPADLMFSVPDLIEYFSRGITMLPGDIVATGSPLGPGIGFKPPKFLKAGDTVKITSKVLGTLETPII